MVDKSLLYECAVSLHFSLRSTTFLSHLVSTSANVCLLIKKKKSVLFIFHSGQDLLCPKHIFSYKRYQWVLFLWYQCSETAVDSRWRSFLEENTFVLLHWATNPVRALFLSSKPSTSLVLVSSFPQYIHKITIIKHLRGIFSEKCTNKKDKLIWRKKTTTTVTKTHFSYSVLTISSAKHKL